jgi:hypothetical protein
MTLLYNLFSIYISLPTIQNKNLLKKNILNKIMENEGINFSAKQKYEEYRFETLYHKI